MGRKTFVVALGVGLLLSALYLTVPETNNVPPETTADQLQQDFQNISFQRNLENGEQWNLKAEKAIRMDTGFYVKEPRVVYLKSSEKSMLARAREARFYEEARKLQLTGRVEVRRPREGKLFCTESLRWSFGEDLVETDQKVILLEPNRRLSAVGMVGNRNLERVQFQSDVQVESGSFSLECSW